MDIHSYLRYYHHTSGGLNETSGFGDSRADGWLVAALSLLGRLSLFASMTGECSEGSQRCERWASSVSSSLPFLLFLVLKVSRLLQRKTSAGRS